MYTAHTQTHTRARAHAYTRRYTHTYIKFSIFCLCHYHYHHHNYHFWCFYFTGCILIGAYIMDMYILCKNMACYYNDNNYSLHTDFHSCIISESFTSPCLPFQHGVPQGDCLSPLLFNLCFNTFVQFIKHGKHKQL